MVVSVNISSDRHNGASMLVIMDTCSPCCCVTRSNSLFKIRYYVYKLFLFCLLQNTIEFHKMKPCFGSSAFNLVVYAILNAFIQQVIM